MTDWTPETSEEILLTAASEAKSGDRKLVLKIAIAILLGLGLSAWGYASSGSLFSFAILIFAGLWCLITAINTPAGQNVGRAIAITNSTVHFNNRDDVLLEDISGVGGTNTSIILKRKFDKKKPLLITDVPNASDVRDLLKKLKHDQRPDYERP
ncbi:hypothetical protein [Algirhabdus cladophorae]|uniref:hypothetical protein n=1 Tax=Algirhabdus cladophorae TaxID=3377108 RepID=UPI003B84588C